MAILRLTQASAIIDATLAEARSRHLAPLAVAVLDAGGHLIAFKREDGAGFVRFDIANGKAWGALGMGFGTRELTARAAKSPAFVAALSVATQGRMIPSPGGVLIAGTDGEVLERSASPATRATTTKPAPWQVSRLPDWPGFPG